MLKRPSKRAVELLFLPVPLPEAWCGGVHKPFAGSTKIPGLYRKIWPSGAKYLP